MTLNHPRLPTSLSAGKDRGLTNTAPRGTPLGGHEAAKFPQTPPAGTGKGNSGFIQRMGLGGRGRAPAVPPRFG